MDTSVSNDMYIKQKISNVINVYSIVVLNYFSFENEYQYESEKHNFWELVYVDKGELTIHTERKQYLLHKGECAIHKPNEEHSHSAEKSTEYFVIGFVCHSLYMNMLRKTSYKLNPKLLHFITSILSESKNAFEIKYNEPNNQQVKPALNEVLGSQQLIKTYLEQFFIMLLRQENEIKSSNTPEKVTLAEKLVEQLKKMIEMNLYKQITVEKLCGEMNYSKAYLSRIFLAECGVTIGDYITACKIAEAKRLIRRYEYNFTQIADMLCFSNSLYFSRVFRKITGMSPSEYKKSVKI